ncbi:glycosyltransferase [Gemmatirosa kalamazoonensis]|uniref:glycosyltransferase n=1 Tax=Gemmatirosa kalamazoonensis TaxID=861299 RepID=UPI00130EF8C4|nr:glycosyltransferase family 2 protein [Gemmatirosa kalamazoonensis]
MTNVSDVAVVVVNYRTPALTVACVESVLRSEGGPPRVIVVDNASGDDSVARLRAAFGTEPAVTVCARDVNDGYTGGNNAGVGLARAAGARWALLLNSDTELDPGCVRRLVEEAASDAEIALATPRIFFGDDPERLWFGGGRFSPWRGRPVHVGFRRRAARGWRTRRDLAFASGCALLVRLDAVRGDPFDASLFAYAEDLDLSLRLRRAGRRIRYVPDALVWHHEGSSHRRAGGQALRFYLNTRNLLRVVARHARWYHWPVLGPMLAVNVVARYAAVAARAGDWSAVGAVGRGAVDAVLGVGGPMRRR